MIIMVYTLYANVCVCVCVCVCVLILPMMFRICLMVFRFIVDITNSFIRVYLYSVRSWLLWSELQ